MLNFTWLAKVSTSRAPTFKGLLPTIGTLLSLLAVSAAVAGAIALWTSALATMAVFVPLFVKTVVAIAGLALLNFWFQREITTATLNAREIRQGFHFDENNPTNIRKLVDHVVEELNIHFEKKHGSAHVPLQTPRLCVYTDIKPELQMVPGRSPAHAALLFSSSFFDSLNTRLNQKHIAALVALRLTQIYYRRGWASTLVGIAADFLRTFETFQDSNVWYYQLLGLLAGPLRFFFYVQKAVDRSHYYEATKTVRKIGRGNKFYDAIDIAVAPSLCKQPGFSYLLVDQANKKRPAHKGFFKRLVDYGNSLGLIEDPKKAIGDPKKSSLFARLINRLDRIVDWLERVIDAWVLEWGYYLQEIASSKPRTTRVKDEMRPHLGIGNIGKALIIVDRLKTLRQFIEEKMRTPEKMPKGTPKGDKEASYDSVSLVSLTEELEKKLQTTGILDRTFKELSEQPNLYKKVLKTLCREEMNAIDRRDRVINEKLYEKISTNKRYEPVSPMGEGIRERLDRTGHRAISAA